MKVYIDITLLPSDDIGHYFLWEKVYQQVHLALVENQQPDGSSSVGIGFPEFNGEKHRLGRKLRVFAPNREVIDKLNIHHWLSRLSDYVHLKDVSEVPVAVKSYERYNRLQTKSNVERLARRAAKRHNISYEQALKERNDLVPQQTNAPYIWMRSLSSDSRFKLFIVKEEAGPAEGGFTTYGLSKGGCLPLF
jgi:CRISPR-associated endonuclease Csy4